MPASLARYCGALADFFLPRICCGCGERVVEPGLLICPRCFLEIKPLLLPLCPTCGREDVANGGGTVCEDCPAGEIHFESARGTTAFRGVAKTVVEKLKYGERLEYAPIMAQRMAAEYETAFVQFRPDAVVAVPLHSSRMRERGFNQSALLANGIGAALKLPVENSCLKRVRSTTSQTRLSRPDRALNIQDAFSAPRPAYVCGKSFLIIDDVYTTGATLNECAKTLKLAGAAEVHCYAFARTILS